MREYKQCIDCKKIILPEETKLPYADGCVCLSCYLLSTNKKRFPKQHKRETDVMYNSELTVDSL